MSGHGSSHHTKKASTHKKKHLAKVGVLKDDTTGKPEGFNSDYDHMHAFSEKVHNGAHVKNKCNGGKM